MVTASLLTFSVLSATVGTIRNGINPLTAGLWLWAAIIGLRVIMPLDLIPMSDRTALIIGLGILGLAMPAILAQPASAGARTEPETGNGQHSEITMLAIISLFIIALAVVGALTFRSSVADVAGASFSDLTAQQVRTAQNGSARGSSPLLLLFALTPLLACLGIVGWRRHSPLWLALPLIATAIVLQSPARTAVLTVVIQLAVFTAYTRKSKFPRKDVPKRGFRSIFPIAIGVAAAGMIFNLIGSRLGKNSYLSSYFPFYPWPEWTLGPLVYYTGGISALTAAESTSGDPLDQGSSMYTLTRLGSYFHPGIEPAETIGAWVTIPVPYNIYTGFGQVYFDFGLLGVVTVMAVFGYLAMFSHRRALNGVLAWAWVSSSMAALLLSLPLGFRLFNLDVVFQLAVGFWAFSMLQRARSSRQSPSASSTRQGP